MKSTELKNDWTTLSPEEKREQLYLKQRQTLEMFHERKAISDEDYRRGLEALNRQAVTNATQN